MCIYIHNTCAQSRRLQYIHTYVQTTVHTYVQTTVHTYVQATVHTYVQTTVHTYVQATVHTYVQATVHTYVQTTVHTCVQTIVHTCVQTTVHMYTHTHVSAEKSSFIVLCFLLESQADQSHNSQLPSHSLQYPLRAKYSGDDVVDSELAIGVCTYIHVLVELCSVCSACVYIIRIYLRMYIRYMFIRMYVCTYILQCQLCVLSVLIYTYIRTYLCRCYLEGCGAGVRLSPDVRVQAYCGEVPRFQGSY